MRWVIAAVLIAATTVVAVADQLVEVTAEKLNVRAAPSITAQIVGQVSKHDRLLITPVSDGWAAIGFGDQIDGFISTKYVNVVEWEYAPAEAQQETTESSEALLAVVLLALFIGALFLHKSSKKKTVGNPPEPRERGPEEETACSDEFREGTPNVRRDFESASLATSRIEADSTPTVHDFPMARVEYVIDGDTVIVAQTWRKTKIRLDSIDCPEDGQPWGDIATAGLIKMIGGRRIRFEEHGEDVHGRLLATIYVQDGRGSEWVNVNEKMVVKGHAWVMRKYYDHLPQSRRIKLNRLEKWARTKRVGLWRTPDPIPPWRWRRIG